MDPLPRRHDLTLRVRRALERISGTGSPEDIAALAEELYRGTFEREPETGSVRTSVPLIAEHTRYFEGFGILMGLPGGVGIAACPGGGALEVVASGEYSDEIERFVTLLCEQLGDVLPSGAEAAVVCASPAGGAESVLAAAGVATVRVLGGEMSDATAAELITSSVESVLGRPCGPAAVLAAMSGEAIVAVDAGRSEYIAVERPEMLGAALVEVGPERLPGAATFREHAELLESALGQLRHSGYPNLGSLRKLEHQELPAALSIVDVQARPLLRHLVTEDRRVQRMIVALRRSDVQVLGALLMMSHASRRDDMQSSTEEVEFVVEQAEVAEGLYGARMAGAGYGGRVLLVGRPFLLPDIVDGISAAFHERFGTEPRATLL